MKRYWEIIADKLSKAGWTWGCVATVHRKGQTIFVADAHRVTGFEKILTRNGNPDSMNIMKVKTIGLTLTLCFFGTAFCFADDPQIGTWKLNEGKSKFAPGATKVNTVVYEAAGDKVKVTVDGTDKDGKSTHNEWTGKFDGNDYAVTGDPTSDMRSYKKIDDHTLKMTVKKDGKVTATGRIVVSADGKSRTVTTKGTDPEGKNVKNAAVYDKQ